MRNLLRWIWVYLLATAMAALAWFVGDLVRLGIRAVSDY